MRILHVTGAVCALLLSIFAVVDASAQESAALQRYRGNRRRVSGGVMNMRADSLAMRADSLLAAADSLAAGAVGADSLLVAAQTGAPAADSLRTASEILAADSLHTASEILAADSLATAAVAGTDSLALAAEMLGGELIDPQPKSRSFGSRLMPDSMSLSKVCWVSAVLPGYGQIYNKQYWKLPVLYGLVGTSLGMFIHENNTYRPLKKEYDLLTNDGLMRTEQLDALQTKMIRSNTRREIYLGAMIASYIYFLGDAAVNYSTNEVSDVKKATTLSTICPGAGQIYNRSYWKVPFVVGGFASLIYCVDWNNRGYQRFQKAYRLLADYDANPDKYPDGPTDEFRGRYSTSFIKNLKDSYRRNRDLCIIITAGIYILQIIDAHVDAHLRDYDISDDLSMNIEPLVEYNYVPAAGGHRPMYGFNISVNF